MAGRGRGRGLTLPAWMTSGSAEGSAPAAVSPASSSTPASSTASSLSTAPSAPASSSASSTAASVSSDNKEAANQFLQTESAPAPRRIVHISAPPPSSAPPAAASSAPSSFQQPPQQHQPQQQQHQQQPLQQQIPQQPPQQQYQQYYAQQQQFQQPPQYPGGLPGGMAFSPSTAYPPQPFQPPPQQPLGAPFYQPVGGPPGGAMMPPRAFSLPVPPPPAAPTLNDPLNDVKSWSEHVGETDKRVFWHNKVTKTSTYDKPECLKCPEERSIPPCRWKEHSKDGKIYYSDGKVSVWAVPDEFRDWKARVEAAVARRKAALQGPVSSPPAASGAAAKTSEETSAGGASSRGREKEEASLQQQVPRVDAAAVKAVPVQSKEVEQAVEVVTYASEKEAVQAFKELLADHNVTAVMKFKDVQELCSNEARWFACKSAGARKQALSEYQTKKLKAEKEEKRIQSRKKRDLFFQLLAETTAIDGRTRWRDAQPLLQESRRYKQIEDDREREEYFTEFVIELAKKEKEDLMELKKMVKVNYVAVLDEMFAAGKIKRNAIWADVKDAILGRLDSKLNTLDDADKRHMFQDYMLELEERLRREERAAEEAWKRKLKSLQESFREHLQSLVSTGAVTAHTKWREVKPTLVAHPTFISLLDFVEGSSSREKDQDGKDAPLVPSSSTSKEGGPRDVFDDVITILLRAEREDKRLLRRIFEDGLEFYNKDSNAVEFMVDAVKHYSSANETKKQLENFVTNASVTKDCKIFKYKALLAEILTERKHSFNKIFDTFVSEKMEELAAKEKKQRKYEDRYLDLLDDYYYRSDHVGLQWEEAKRDLSRKSAYLDLPRERRKSLFLNHMEELAAELAKKSSYSNRNGTDRDVEEGEIALDEDVDGSDPVGEHSNGRGHESSASRSRSRSRSRSGARSLSGARSSGARSRSRSGASRGKTRSSRGHSDDDHDRDDKVSTSSKSGQRREGATESNKRKRHDTNDGRDSGDEDEEFGRERKSKKSKKEKKEKKSHKHSHKHRSHRDRSHDGRS